MSLSRTSAGAVNGEKVMNWFFRFAERMQRVIASPYHLAAFLAATALWLGWAIVSHFSIAAQIALNTPTTWAEYLFEILVLAAALKAAANTDDILRQIRDYERRIIALEEQALERLDAEHRAETPRRED